MFNWSAFIPYVITVGITPGPNNITSMSNASKVGLKKSYFFNLGVMAGFFIVAVICAIFCSALSKILPIIQTPMLFIGAIYMLFLAYKIFVSSTEIGEEKTKLGFLNALVLQFINPKVYLGVIISLEAYVLPAFSNQYLIILFCALLAINAFNCTLCWALFGSLFRKILSKYGKITNTIMALLLVYCAISLFI